MTELFVHSSAFVALNDPSNPNNENVSSFVQALLSDSLTIFTSVDEVTRAAEIIRTTVGKDKEQQFLALVFSGGIRMLFDDHKNLQQVVEVYGSLDDKSELVIADVQCTMLMKQYGIKHVLTFNTEFQALGVITVPKS